MARRGGSGSVGGGWSPSSPAQSSNSAAAGGSRGGRALPIIDCPQCLIPVIKLRSGTPKNPGRWFYKCPRHHKVQSECPERFYKWEDDYENYVYGRDLKIEGDEQLAELKNNNEEMMELICAMNKKTDEILCVVNSNSRQIASIVLVGITCAFFMLVCAMLMAVMIRM